MHSEKGNSIETALYSCSAPGSNGAGLEWGQLLLSWSNRCLGLEIETHDPKRPHG